MRFVYLFFFLSIVLLILLKMKVADDKKDNIVYLEQNVTKCTYEVSLSTIDLHTLYGKKRIGSHMSHTSRF